MSGLALLCQYHSSDEEGADVETASRRSRTLIGVFFLPQQLPQFLNLLRSAPMGTMLHLRPPRPWRPRFIQALMMRLGASGASATFLLQPPSQRLRLLRHRLPPPLGGRFGKQFKPAFPAAAPPAVPLLASSSSPSKPRPATSPSWTPRNPRPRARTSELGG